MRCNNCGWDNPDNRSVCEKCGNPLAGGSSYHSSNHSSAQYVQQEELHSTVREDAVFNMESQPRSENVEPSPRISQAPVSGTVNPWMQQISIAKCSLTPIRQYGEQGEIKKCLFKGDKNELNRANLDPENPTITSHSQALLSFENGKWYVEDKSSQNTTFIHVGNKHELQNGDILLMGNRMFVFKQE